MPTGKRALKVERGSIADLKFDQRNANKGTERGDWMLESSLQRNGIGRGVVAAKDGTLAGGNKTAAKAGELGYDEVIFVHTTGRELVVTVRDDLEPDSPAFMDLALDDNRVGQINLAWDPGVLGVMADGGVDLSERFYDNELSDLLDVSLADFGGEEPEESVQVDVELEQSTPLDGVPDAVWPSDNDYQIPLLDVNLQADAFDMPFVIWGSQARKSRMPGTYGFYTEDYRFSRLWTSPNDLIESGCINAFEANNSLFDQMPFAVALYKTYQKRWMSRYWQSKGVRVFVDLNVASRWYEMNLLGVPRGWKAYCTRGYDDQVEYVQVEYDLAVKHAGSTSILFVVYGGGSKVKALCQSLGLLHMEEDMDRAKAGTKERTDKGT